MFACFFYFHFNILRKSAPRYIDDLDSGRIELTSERTDLEKEIKDLQASIKEEEDMRAKEYDA